MAGRLLSSSLFLRAGSPVIDCAREERIGELLAPDELSRRAIARRTGTSRGTVDAIASGRRPADLSRSHQAERMDTSSDQPSGPAVRCPGCGGLVYLPCRLCRARAARKANWLPRFADRPIPPLTIALQGENEECYLALRARKVLESSGELLDREPTVAEATEDWPDCQPSDADLRRLEPQADSA